MRFIFLYILTLVIWVGGNILVQMLVFKLFFPENEEEDEEDEMEEVELDELKQMGKDVAATGAYYLLFAAGILLVAVFPAIGTGGIQLALVSALAFSVVCHVVGAVTNLEYTRYNTVLTTLVIAGISIAMALLATCIDYYVALWIY